LPEQGSPLNWQIKPLKEKVEDDQEVLMELLQIKGNFLEVMLLS
jgi:hypothetical protein